MEKWKELLSKRFGKDSLMALATIDESGKPWARTIDAIFYEGSFYTITYALSNKIKQINKNPNIAISGEWFSGHAMGIDMTFEEFIAFDANQEVTDREVIIGDKTFFVSVCPLKNYSGYVIAEMVALTNITRTKELEQFQTGNIRSQLLTYNEKLTAQCTRLKNRKEQRCQSE